MFNFKYKWLVAPAVGNLFEWYEFAIFTSMSNIIGKLFFNASSHLGATILGFLVYGIAYAARPIGTFIFGYIGDRSGRKNALSSSLILMFAATMIIPFIPSYSKIGILSSISLVFIRILQGISFGGEFSSVVTYTCETAPNGKKGLLSAMHVSVVMIAIVLGLLTVKAIYLIFNDEQILDYAWKIPFFMAVLIGIFGIYVRSRSLETPEFIKIQTENKIVKNPFIYFFKNHYKQFIITTTWFLPLFLPLQVFTIGAKSTLENVFYFHPIAASNYGIFLCLLAIPFILLCGKIIETVPLDLSKTMYSVSFIISSILICYLLNNNLVIFGYMMIAGVSGFGHGMYYYYLYKKIPVESRDTGVGFSVALAAMISSGFGMILFLNLFKKYGENGINIFFIMIDILFVLSIIVDFALNDKNKRSL